MDVKLMPEVRGVGASVALQIAERGQKAEERPPHREEGILITVIL